MNRLQEIIEYKKKEIEKIIPLTDKLRYAAVSRNDFRSLEASILAEEGRLGLIAEVKKASPSAGVIVADFDPVKQAQRYAAAGASGISVLTDEKFFKGRLDYLVRIRKEVSIPVLRKDFIIHEAQIYEASVAGADAILLIVAALEQDQLIKLLSIATTYQLEVLMEVHDHEELERALETEARMIGINNRNLKTFEVDLQTTEDLADEIPDDIVLVSESGIRTPEDASFVYNAGANAVLIGEALMRSEDVEDAVIDFMNAPLPPVGGEDIQEAEVED